METKPAQGASQSKKLSDVLAGAARDCWLALAEDGSRVVGRGASMQEAVDEARKNGVDDPVVLWSPRARVDSAF